MLKGIIPRFSSSVRSGETDPGVGDGIVDRNSNESDMFDSEERGGINVEIEGVLILHSR
jgi:hypothetical protein